MDTGDSGETMSAMTDEQLAQGLRQFNAEFGPIISVTRSVYARKLARLRADAALSSLGDGLGGSATEQGSLSLTASSTPAAHRTGSSLVKTREDTPWTGSGGPRHSGAKSGLTVEEGNDYSQETQARKLSDLLDESFDFDPYSTTDGDDRLIQEDKQHARLMTSSAAAKDHLKFSSSTPYEDRVNQIEDCGAEIRDLAGAMGKFGSGIYGATRNERSSSVRPSAERSELLRNERGGSLRPARDEELYMSDFAQGSNGGSWRYDGGAEKSGGGREASGVRGGSHDVCFRCARGSHAGACEDSRTDEWKRGSLEDEYEDGMPGSYGKDDYSTSNFVGQGLFQPPAPRPPLHPERELEDPLSRFSLDSKYDYDYTSLTDRKTHGSVHQRNVPSSSSVRDAPAQRATGPAVRPAGGAGKELPTAVGHFCLRFVLPVAVIIVVVVLITMLMEPGFTNPI